MSPLIFRHIVILSLIIVMPFRVINAQNYPYERYEKDEDKELPGRFFIAPDFGLVLGDLTRIEVSPSLGYHLTPRFIMGIGGRYEYVRKRNFITRQIDVNTHVYGYRLFSRLIVIEDLADIVPIQVPIGIFGHIEFEGLSLEERHFRLGAAPDIEGRFWLNSVLAGAGINQPTGPRSSFNVMVLWDITNSASSPYINPILKFGIQFYLGRAN